MSLVAIADKVKTVLVDGIATELYRAQEAIFLFKMIADHIELIKEQNFDNLFGTVQQQCVSALILSLTKIFEDSKHNDVQSFPWLLNYLNANQSVKNAFSNVENFADNIANWQKELEKIKTENASAIKKLKLLRDKKIAHGELLGAKDVEGPTWEETEALIEHAKDLQSEIAFTLINFVYKFDNGSYAIDDNAIRAATALNRLFKSIFKKD